MHASPFRMDEYLAARKRSATEGELHALLQRVSGGKISVEEMQRFCDQTPAPLDVLRKYESQFEFSEREIGEFMRLLMSVWNNTPRTELHGKTPDEVKRVGGQRCKLCEEPRRCPQCDGPLREGETKSASDGSTFGELRCAKCDKTFTDMKFPFHPTDEKTETLISDIATNITNDNFADIWADVKKDLKDLSKRKIAEEMFHAGLGQAFTFLTDMGMPRELLEVWKRVSEGNVSDAEQLLEKLKGEYEKKEK